MSSNRELRLALSLIITALGYWALARLARDYFAPDAVVSVFWPAAGWALARVVLHGRAHAWAAAAGGALASAAVGDPLPYWLIATAAAAAAALLGQAWLARAPRFNPDFPGLPDFLRLLMRGALGAGLTSALVGTSGLAALGMLTGDALPPALLYWLGGDLLGIMIATPLVLAWSLASPRSLHRPRAIEAALCLGLVLLLGQMIFLGWLPELAPTMQRKGYWLLPLLLWAALRLGPRGVSTLLALVAVQVMLGIQANVGFFAGGALTERLLDGWLFLMVSTLIGMTLATYIGQRMRAEEQLRIAGIAFECQEGIIVVDANLRILRTNRSFSRIMGYAADEVLGRTTSFMRSDRHPPAFYENAWRTVREQGSWSDEVWHRRKSGEVFPQWLTATAVKDQDGVMTHFVVTHTDLTELKQKEAAQQARQIAQRDALIREVHHRIKNSLQGITGVLRHFARTYPQTESVMSHAISLVKSISVLHGLQGRAGSDVSEAVRLEDLLQSIGDDIRSVWKTPVTVDLSALDVSAKVAPNETVPIAMIVSELLVNAIKHGGNASGHVGVSMEYAEPQNVIRITMSNEGTLAASSGAADGNSGGLMLIDSMMPRSGATLSIQQLGNHVITCLELAPPVISIEPRTIHVNP
ncbi:MAG: MASE1 domain-containing protein [Hylemonella sp.]|nr:MASE1 domain-containing protein [Hylemonella sp.]